MPEASFFALSAGGAGLALPLFMTLCRGDGTPPRPSSMRYSHEFVGDVNSRAEFLARVGTDVDRSQLERRVLEQARSTTTKLGADCTLPSPWDVAEVIACDVAAFEAAGDPAAVVSLVLGALLVELERLDPAGAQASR